jgi:hypothetical protein
MKKPLVQLIIAGLILVFITVGYGLWFVAVDTENAKARDLAGQIISKGQESQRIAAAKAALAVLSTDEDSVSQHFVAPDSIVSFLGGIEAMGKALGARVQVVSVAADQSKTKLGHINLAVTVTGPFDSVIRTLGALEYSPYDIVLTNMSLDTTGAPAQATPTPTPIAPGAPHAASGPKVWSATLNLVVGTGPTATSTRSRPAAAIIATSSPSVKVQTHTTSTTTTTTTATSTKP